MNIHLPAILMWTTGVLLVLTHCYIYIYITVLVLISLRRLPDCRLDQVRLGDAPVWIGTSIGGGGIGFATGDSPKSFIFWYSISNFPIINGFKWNIKPSMDLWYSIINGLNNSPFMEYHINPLCFFPSSDKWVAPWLWSFSQILLSVARYVGWAFWPCSFGSWWCVFLFWTLGKCRRQKTTPGGPEVWPVGAGDPWDLSSH